MRDANYLRARAELFLEIARQMSDQTTAEGYRTTAARCRTEAAKIDPPDDNKPMALSFVESRK
jgi:hypothetical protein